MGFRQGGHRDKRWRRVLTGEAANAAPEGRRATQAPSAEPTDASLSQPARRYSEAALSPNQPRVVDLIPTRWWTNLVLFLLTLSCVAGIEALYGYLALGYAHLEVSLFPAIDLTQRGSVATWFSSAIWAVCAAFGLLIYRIRRHRTDDYRGRYRMWSWMVPAFILASIDQVAGIRESIGTLVLYTANGTETADPQLIWMAGVALLIAIVGLRLFMEMRVCRFASLLLVTALAGFTVVDAVRLGWLLVDASVFRVMVTSTLTMLSHVVFLMAILFYARHVHRDAAGLISIRRRRGREAEKQMETRRKKGSEQGSRDDTGRRSRTPSQERKALRRKAGKVTRIDPAHEAVDASGSPNDSTKAKATAGRATRASDRSQQKEKRRVVANASTVKAASSSAALCEPDDDQVVESRKLSKAERKRLRKQRRKERQG